MLRLLATLEAHDFVRRTERGYDVGYGVLEVASVVEPEIREAARPALVWLAEQYGETAVVSIRDEMHAVAVDQVVPKGRVVRVHYHPGSRHPLSEAAHGKCMLAMDDDAATRSSVDASELGKIRTAGYATSRDELEAGVSGLAAPIFDGVGAALAAIGVVAPTLRMPPEPDLAAAVVSAARAATAALTGTDASRTGSTDGDAVLIARP